MPDRLEDYNRKRRLAETPEPAGAQPPATDSEQPRYVVQEHSARSMHWDLRLERDGLLVSWAVPRGIPDDPKRNGLAVRTEDHPLEYLDFEGVIPEGHYGAGTMKIWDRGTYELHKFRDDEVMVTFHGERLEGKYVLFRTRGKDWMIHRMDPPADPTKEPMPERIDPMLASLGTLPRDDSKWAFEIKWDGIRATAYISGGRVRFTSRTGRDVTRHYPELAPLGRALGALEAVVDGEIVAFGPDGRPSFQKLQGRMHLTSDSAIKRLAKSDPVTFVIFDLLFLDGRTLCPLPYETRRDALARLELAGPSWQTPSHHVGDGAAMLALTRQQGLEGVIAKKLDCPYSPGKRVNHWLKIKNVSSTEVTIAGWVPGEGRRHGHIGALVVGREDDDGQLVYAGKVGTGFDEAELRRLYGLLSEIETDTSPFASGRQPERATRFVEPKLRCKVEYLEWTSAGTLRAPSYKGLIEAG